jgi:hypothetical protein
LAKAICRGEFRRRKRDSDVGGAQSFKKAIDMTDDELAAITSRARLALVKSDTSGVPKHVS